ncbi:sulfotransferase 1C2A [Caerostris extrusa]|uniref:Sulfotransferase 1C2A n=1 Tax=Caerostris extrusa TaxID=172846 RepID=A0AAV4UZF1_CAEEX|nr:sulfotransferase 1C2A [Caerostris extrusa]
MKKDIKGVILKLSRFLGKEYIEAIEKDNSVLNNIIYFSGFEYMKKHLSDVYDIEKDEKHVGRLYTGFLHSYEFTKDLNLPDDLPELEFVRKGIVGDWKNHFSAEQTERLNKKFLQKLNGTEVLEWYPLEY